MLNKRWHMKSIPVWLPSALCAALTVLFAALGWLAYQNTGFKCIAIAAGAGIAALLWLCDLKRLGGLRPLLLLAHAAFTMLTVFWALSGKFFLGRYAVTFTAVFFFLYAVLRGRGHAGFARRAMSVMAGISTVYAVLGVEAASTGYFRGLGERLLGHAVVQRANGIGAERMCGVFNNPNIEASFCAIGIIFSVALICGSKKRWQRALWMFALVCNACALLLGISIGAIGCFGVACVIYLIAAGRERGSVLLRMVVGAVCASAGVLCALSPFGKCLAFGGAEASCLWVAMLLAAILAAVLEFLLGEKLSTMLAEHEKAAFGAVLAVLAAVALYLGVGITLTGPCTFSDSVRSIQRGVVLEPGEQTIELDADAHTFITIDSRSTEQVMTEESTLLFRGTVEEAQNTAVTVPADSSVCMVTLSGEPGAEIRSVTIGGKRVKLIYRALPSFVANRLITPGGSFSLLQRLTYVRDGMKIFRLSPLYGLGDGAFEASIHSVQDYEYESKHSHNQYVESLIEGGVIGFALFAGALVMLGVSLWKARGRERTGEASWLYPALCAEFVMSALQMFWDVTMYVTVFACMIYTLYGMIVATCAEPFAVKKTDDGLPSRKSGAGVRGACCALPVLFALSVGLNIYAQRLINQPAATLDEFMGNLERAIKVDLYEKNDAKLSYVCAAMEHDGAGVYRERADAYAEELSRVRSNAMPGILNVYYLNTQQYERAIEEAKLGAQWSASDSDMWNSCAGALKQIFIDSGAYSPLLADGGDGLLRALEEYREMLLARDARSLKPIRLNENSVVFFDTVGELFACRDDQNALYALLTGAES